MMTGIRFSNPREDVVEHATMLIPKISKLPEPETRNPKPALLPNILLSEVPHRYMNQGSRHEP